MSLFGGMPFPVQFFLAFVIVLGLIGATAWAVRRFGAGSIGGAGMRGRQPRLAVVDYASVDGRRRLLLVRRDNVEHLVMIGGPTDVVVESNIVRAAAAPREIAIPRPAPAVAESLPHAIPLPDNSSNGSWPLQPEPAAAPSAPRPPRNEQPRVEQPRGEPVRSEPPHPEPTAPWPMPPQVETPSRQHRDTLAALADELSTRQPAQPRSRPQPPQPPARPQPVEARQEPRQEPRQELRQEPRHEPRVLAEEPPEPEADAGDQSLAEMAHRLEAALRKPNARQDRNDARNDAREARPAPMPRAVMPAEPVEMAEPAPAPAAPLSAPARATRTAEAKAPRSDASKQPAPGKTLYDSLEQEMASLLGRPTAKH
jgi:flagellar protein FliO/FliZ